MLSIDCKWTRGQFPAEAFTNRAGVCLLARTVSLVDVFLPGMCQGVEFLVHGVCVVIFSKYTSFSKWLEIVGSFCFVTRAQIPC